MWFQSDVIICFGLPDSLVSLSVWQFTIYPSPLWQGASVNHLKLKKNTTSHPDSPQCYVNALLQVYSKSSVTHHLLSRISAGFTTCPCLNTPVLQHLSRAAVRVAQQQHFSHPWYWILATFCSPLWTMTEVTADAPSDQPRCVGWMISCTRSEN